MSKRPRDDTKIESVRSILGDIPIETIERLLNSANQNVETAINLYFTDPPPLPTPPTQNDKRIKQDTPARTIDKYYIGDLVITGTVKRALFIIMYCLSKRIY